MLYCYIYLASLIQSDYIIYTSPEKDYSVVVNNKARYIRNEAKDDSKGYTDMFTVMDEINPKVVNYFITVIKLHDEDPVSETMVLSDVFMDGFKKRCNCDVLSSKGKVINKSNGLFLKIKVKNSPSHLMGNVFLTAKGGHVFTVCYYAVAEKFEQFQNESDHSINTFKLIN